MAALRHLDDPAIDARVGGHVGEIVVAQHHSAAARGDEPEITRSVVDLPAALAPTSATISRSRTSSETLGEGLEVAVEGVDALKPEQEMNSSPEIGVDDAPVLGDRGRGPLGDPLAVVEHHDTVGEAHHGGHDVLDHEHREPVGVQALDQRDHRREAPWG